MVRAPASWQATGSGLPWRGRIHLCIWWMVTAPVWLVSVFAALLLGQPGYCVAVSLTAGLLVGPLVASFASEGGPSRQELVKLAGRTSVLTIALCLGLIGLFAALDWIAVVVVVVVVGSSPYAMTLLGRVVPRRVGGACLAESAQRTRPGKPGPPRRLLDLADGDLAVVAESWGPPGLPTATGNGEPRMQELSTEQVVRAWRLSYGLLSEAPSPVALAWLADYRGRCLVELERRELRRRPVRPDLRDEPAGHPATRPLSAFRARREDWGGSPRVRFR